MMTVSFNGFFNRIMVFNVFSYIKTSSICMTSMKRVQYLFVYLLAVYFSNVKADNCKYS